jgi:uncharacterized NAD(P)/FAD-binding protein YdhS
MHNQSSRKMNFNFAIIGGGLTATCMLYQFVNRVHKKRHLNPFDYTKIGVHVFEKHNTFGPGFPYCDMYVMPFHLTNMCAKDMGILFDYPRDFQDWVENYRLEIHDRIPYLDASFSSPDVGQDPCVHYPRAVMGEYLTTRFQEAVQLAQDLGLKVSLHPNTEVIDVDVMDGRIRIDATDLLSGQSFRSDADRVLLATGHWFEESEQDRYFSSPWPAEHLLRNIPEGEEVAVIGTSLSAIETVLTLSSDGQFVRDDSAGFEFIPSKNPRRFALYSRRGLLPKVRGKMGLYRNTYLTLENVRNLRAQNNGFLPLETVFHLLNSDLEAAYGRPMKWDRILNPTANPEELLRQYLMDAKNGDGPDGELIWQTVLHQSFNMAREFYLSLTPQDKERFDKTYTSLFFNHAATQPAINAEKLLALMQAGFVKVFKLGDNYRFFKNDTTGCYEFIYPGIRGQTQRGAYRYVVNARGQERSMQTNPSALARNLLSSGTVQTEKFQHGGDRGVLEKRTADIQGAGYHTQTTGSILIDPETHRVMRREPDGTVSASNAIYAVGAMTRGQILDASMAQGIAQSTARIAHDLVDYLSRVLGK